MLQRRSRRLSVILKKQNIFEALVFFEIENPVAKNPQHIFNPLRGQRRQARIVIRRLNNHLVRPNPIHPVEHSLGLPVEHAFNSQRGKLVRHHPHRPPWRVPLRSRAAIRRWPVSLDFRRGLTLIPVTKRTEATLQLHVFPRKIGWPLGTVRRNNYPPSHNRIFSQLRHPGALLSSRWQMPALEVRQKTLHLSRQGGIAKHFNLRPTGFWMPIVYAYNIEPPLARRWRSP